MAIREIQIGTCDLCNEEIDMDKRYVDAMVYGAAFHNTCIEPHKIALRALELDEIRQMPTCDKYIYD